MSNNGLRNAIFITMGIVIGFLIGMTYGSVNNQSDSIVYSYENLTEYASFAIEKDADSIKDEREILERFSHEVYDDFMYIRKNAQGRLFLGSRYNDHLHEYLVKCKESEVYPDDKVHDLYMLLEPVYEELNSVNWMKEKGQTPFRTRGFKQMMKNLDTLLSEY